MRKIIRSIVAVATALLFIGTSVAQIADENNLRSAGPKNSSRGTYTYYPSDDSYVGWPNDINGDLPFIALRNGSTNDYWLCAGCVKFDISGIPSNASVISASLSLFYYDYEYSNPVNHPTVLRRFNGDWNEESISRNFMPTWSNIISAVTYLPSSPGYWLTWDVTDDVQDFISGAKPNYGWIIKDEYYWSGPNIPPSYLYSKEAGSLIPYLEISINDDNEDPGVPQISGPTTGHPGNVYDYSFMANDPDSDQIYYWVEWGDGLSSGWLGPYPSGQSIQLAHTWDNPGFYTIEAKVRDTHGAESGWGAYLVNMINNPPQAPQISGPASGVHGLFYNYTFIATDPDSDQIYYSVEWGDGESTGWLGPYASGQSLQLSHVWTDPGSYVIKAKTKDTFGAESNWATIPVTMINNPPESPQITGLTSGTTSTFYNYTIIAIDPDTDQIYYWVEWGDGQSTGWLGPYPSGQSTVTSHAWDNPGTYIIQVKAKDAYGLESGWTSYSITLQTNPPSTPQIIGIVNGTMRETYDYTFLSNDLDGDQIYYWIDWGDGEIIEWIGPYTPDQPITYPHTWKKKGTYVLQAKAKDTYGAESGWGTLVIHMPYSSNDIGLHFLEKLFERFPHLFPILRHWFGYY